MRKNNVLLAAAITATFVVSTNAAYAGLSNYPSCSNNTAACTTPFTASSTAGNLVPIPDLDKGIIYSTHLFGSTNNNAILPSGSEYAAVQWVLEGSIVSDRFELGISLNSDSGAKFSGQPLLVYEGAVDPTAIPIFFNGAVGTINGPLDSCNNTTSCKWRFGKAGTDSKISNGEKFTVLYKITNASNLGTNGSEVKATVKFGTVAQTDIGTQTVTVATSKDPFSIHFNGTNNSYIKVSVGSGNTGFITQVPTSDINGDPEFTSANDVLFGYMVVTKESGVKASNGYTDWKLGDIATSADFDAGYNATAGVLTTLTIKEEGQFAASMGSNGDVYLYINGAPVSAASVTETEAIWQLSNTNLNDIMTYGVGSSQKGKCQANVATDATRCIPIGLQTDGTTQINIPEEDPPKAELVLDYAKDTNKHDIKYPGADEPEERLTKYTQDGISCWVFNVPPPGVLDKFNLRVINDSSTTPVKPDGTPDTECVQATLFAQDGSQIDSKAPLGCPPAGGALYVSDEMMLEKFPGSASMTGRGVLFITSTLSRMEVLAMLRRTTPGGDRPLTNLSTGAHGVACAPEYP